MCTPGLELQVPAEPVTAISGHREPQAHREGWGLVGTRLPEHRAILPSAPANLIVRSATTVGPQYEKP